MSTETQDDAPKSVKEIWEKTIIRFQERTGYTLGSVSKSPEDLRKALDLHYDQQSGDEQTAKAKEMGLKIISCIQILGGIAAQGVSGVFAPAPLCFKALSFVLDIPRKVHEFHREINSILVEVGPALAQFRIYQRMDENTGLDEILLASIYDIMVGFMDICATCINIHREGKWKNLKRNAKRILLDDGSVQSALDDFKKLTQNQLNTQATLTLEVALETNQYVSFIQMTTIEIETDTKAIRTDVSSLVETDQKRSLDETRRKYLTSIKTKLGIKDDQVTNASFSRENMWKSSIENGGKWLNDLDQYTQWVDRNNTNEYLLLLSGDAGTGKSFLVTTIAHEIKSQSSNSASKAERSLIGYYSFSLSAKDDKHRPETAVKIICAQLAEQDFVYAKNIASVCGDKDDKSFRDANCRDLWTTLTIDSPAKNTAHYIIFDSVSSLDTPELERLLEAVQHKPNFDPVEEKGNCVKVLISGEPESFQSKKLLAPNIDITKYNKDDINVFIEQEFKNAGLFQGEDEDAVRLRENFKERLLARSNSSYSTVRQDLDKIKEITGSSGTEAELNRVLQESSAHPKELVKSDIEALETLLKPREIDEVNELLIWVVAGFEWFNLGQLTAALFLRFSTVPLQPLSQKISGKYSKLFSSIHNDEFVILKDYVEEHVVTEKYKPRDSIDDPRITATITISNANVKAVQRFFWDLNHYSFTEGFAFRPGSELNDSFHGKIQLNMVDAHFQILKQAFEFFRQPSVDHRAKAMGEYLMSCIPDHLQALYNTPGFEEFQEKEKKEIWSYINEIFSVGDWIENNWQYQAWVTWYSSSKDIAIFLKWLNDPVATSHLGPLDKKWLADLRGKENSDRGLLTPVITTVAKHWLQNDDWNVLDAYRWIRAFLELDTGASTSEDESKTEPLVEKTKRAALDDDGENDDDGDDSDNISGSTASDGNTSNESEVEMIKKAEEWCKEALNVRVIDYTWCVRLATTFADSNEPVAAIEQYKRAVSILQAEEPVDKKKLCDTFKSLGKCSTDAKTALDYYKQAQEQDPCNEEVSYAMLKRYISIHEADEARLLIEHIVAEKSPEPEPTLLFGLFKSAIYDTDKNGGLSMLMALISFAGSSPELWPVIISAMETAIKVSRVESKTDEVGILLLYLGIARYYFRTNRSGEELSKAVANWRDCLVNLREKVLERDRSHLELVEQEAIGYLSMAYFENQAEVPDEVFRNSPISSKTKYVLASHYVSDGQESEARDFLRSEMVAAFDLLSDDDITNDWYGYTMIRSILGHTGDYENALKASFLVHALNLDEEILQTLLASEDGSMDQASMKIIEFYKVNCQDNGSQLEKLNKVLRQIEKWAEEATAGDSDDASRYKSISNTLSPLVYTHNLYFDCDNCKRKWNYEINFHVCKKCYIIDLCDICWNALRATQSVVFMCNKSHDWWDIEAWNKERYILALKRLVPIQSPEGHVEYITTSKWLGDLCDQWGLSKADWKFQ